MTVDVKIPRVRFFGNGTTAPIPVPFQFDEAADLIVTAFVDGGQTLLVRGSDFNVAGAGSSQGGTVTPLHPILDGVEWEIVRSTALRQPTRLSDGFYSAATHETAFDRQMLALQEASMGLEDVQVRAFLLPRYEQAGPIPPLSQRAGMIAVFSPDGGLRAEPMFGPGQDQFDDGLWTAGGLMRSDGAWG